MSSAACRYARFLTTRQGAGSVYKGAAATSSVPSNAPVLIVGGGYNAG